MAPPLLTTTQAAMLGADARSSPLTSAAAAALATAAALAAAAVLRRSDDVVCIPSWIRPRESSGTKHMHLKGGSSVGPPLRFSGDSSSSDSHSEEEALRSDDEAEACSVCDDSPAPARRRTPSAKVWSTNQFPAGIVGVSNLAMPNLIAAQQWSCPCPDRDNCIGADRLDLLDLYEHRKKWRTSAHTRGGFRDGMRMDMRNHFDKRTNKFTRSFVVGPLGDCCVASVGLACGLSIQSFGNSRADLRYDRPWHAQRMAVHAKQQSAERAHLEAYVRDLRTRYEGPKGGSAPKDKWNAPKKTHEQRWADYKRARNHAKLPIIGSKSLLKEIWNEHDEIVEYGAKGHPKCDKCGFLISERTKHEGNMDKLQEIEEQQVRRDAECPCPFPVPAVYDCGLCCGRRPLFRAGQRNLTFPATVPQRSCM